MRQWTKWSNIFYFILINIWSPEPDLTNFIDNQLSFLNDKVDIDGSAPNLIF